MMPKPKKVYKTIQQLTLDLDKEQSIRINSKEGGFSLVLYKVYGRGGNKDALRRQHLMRINRGQCSVAGCPNRAKKGYKKCQIHIEFDRVRGKLRRDAKHANHKKKIQKNKK